MAISILAYLVFAFILFLTQSYQLQPVRNTNRKNYILAAISSIIIFGLFYGIRYNTGTDNLSYIRIFESVRDWGYTSRNNLEYGYSLIQNIFASLDCHFSIFIGFWGVLQMSLLLYATREWKIIWPFLVVFIVLGPYFLEMSNIMRQTTSFCMFVVMIEFAVKREFLKYYTGAILSYLIHTSSILTIPFYYILRFPIIPKKRFLAILIFIICTIIGNSPTWIDSLKYLGSVLSFLDYDHYANSLNEIITTTKWSIAWGPSRFLTWLLYLLTIWYYYPIKKKYLLDKRIECYFFLFYYGECLYNLLINTDQIFLRPIVYLNDFYIVIVPIILYFLYKEWNQRRAKNPLQFPFYAFLAFFYSIYMCIHGYLIEGVNSSEPYHFFFIR